MKTSFLKCFYLFLIWANAGCNSNSGNINRVYFNINSEDRKIVIPVQLNDSLTVNLSFDTGGGGGTFSLDSTFCSVHQSIVPNTHPMCGQSGSAWSTDRIPVYGYDADHIVKIGNTGLTYNRTNIWNYKKHMNTTSSDGLFNIPQNDTTHVWELNFEHNYLEIHSASDFKMPKDCFVLPMTKGVSNNPNVQLTFKIKCTDGDTLTLKRTFLIDTGAPWDISLTNNVEEVSFFNKKEDAVWLGFLDSYIRYYTVGATVFNNYNIDSLRIYTFDYPSDVKVGYVIGLNFLKRFNLFFDLKNKQLGLQPLNSFHRVINPTYRRFHLSTYVTPQGKIVVKTVGNYKGNYYKTAGFQEGDEMVAVNGKPCRSVTYEDKTKFLKQDSLVYDIIRKEKPMKIIVHVDKDEKQGD